MLDIDKVVVGETKVRIVSLPFGVMQKVGDVGTVVKNDNGDYPLAVSFSGDYWWFNPEHLEIVEDATNEEYVVEYNIGDKFRVVNLDGDLNLAKCGVKVGDVGEVIQASEYNNIVLLHNENWAGEEGYRSKDVCFNKYNIEPFVEITESRWNKIIENIEGGYGLTDEESDVVKSVLKTNVPSNVVADKLDPAISKEVQTHLDANYIGDDGNCGLYYKSDVLKKWFWWNDSFGWEECYFAYEDGYALFPISIMSNKTEES